MDRGVTGPREAADRGVTGAATQDQHRTVVRRLRQQPAVVHPGTRGVTRRSGRGVEHEEAAVDADTGPRSLGQSGGRLPVVQVRAEGRPESSVELPRVDPHDVDVPRSPCPRVAVPPGVDAVRGLARRGQLCLHAVRVRLRGVAAYTDSVTESPGGYVGDGGLPHGLDARAEALRPKPGCLVLGTRPVGQHTGRGVRIRRAGRGRDHGLQRPGRCRIRAAAGDPGQCHARLQAGGRAGLFEVVRTEPQVCRTARSLHVRRHEAVGCAVGRRCGCGEQRDRHGGER